MELWKEQITLAAKRREKALKELEEANLALGVIAYQLATEGVQKVQIATTADLAPSTLNGLINKAEIELLRSQARELNRN